ncbi:MAG: RNA polymerase sigma factor [Candidatus Dormibacteria bacterium]
MGMGMEADQGLALALQERDPDALGQLFDRYGSLCFSLALRIVRDRQTAEEVVQEAYLNAWRKADSYELGKGSLRTWLLTVVRNRALDRLRANRLRVDQQVSLESAERVLSGPDVWREVSENLDRDAIKSALAALPEDQRVAIELAFFGGLTHAELAERLGIPLGTVKGRLRLALLKLRGLLKEFESEETEVQGWGGLRVVEGDGNDL